MMAHLEWLFIGLWAAYLSVSSSVYGLWVDILKACRAGKALPGFKFLVIWKKKKACYFNVVLLSWCLRILSWQECLALSAMLPTTESQTARLPCAYQITGNFCRKGTAQSRDRVSACNAGCVVFKVFALSWCVGQCLGAGDIWVIHFFI